MEKEKKGKSNCDVDRVLKEGTAELPSHINAFGRHHRARGTAARLSSDNFLQRKMDAPPSRGMTTEGKAPSSVQTRLVIAREGGRSSSDCASVLPPGTVPCQSAEPQWPSEL